MLKRFLDLLGARREFSLPRRHLLVGVGLGIGAALGLRRARAELSAEPPYLRPPGAVEEPEFVNRCIRCGACYHACPTHTLVPSGLERNVLAYGSPVLETRHGGCAPDCNACGRACPTGAIQPLSLEAKQKLKMGRADIERSRCVPWAQGTPCTLCFTACPYGAIRWEDTGRALPWGGTLEVPVVDAEKCTGCGLCETACPVNGQAAIVVTPEYPRHPLKSWPPRQKDRRIELRDIS